MNGAKILSDMLGMSDGLVRRALDGLTDADLIKRPSDQDNTIGWLIWRKTRVEDIAFADASGQEQFWISDKWHEKFGMEPNPGQMGFGDSLEQVMGLEVHERKFAWLRRRRPGACVFGAGEPLARGSGQGNLRHDGPDHQNRGLPRQGGRRQHPARRPDLLPPGIYYRIRLAAVLEELGGKTII